MNQISHAVSSHQTIRDRIIALDSDIDETTLADTLEGLTDFNEVVTSVVRAALFDEALAAGLKGYIEIVQKRMQRLAERGARRRRVARDAMIEVDIKKIAAPDFTLSVRPGAPALVVVDEAAIPERYWQPRDPRLDRLGLLADLKLGRSIAGVQLNDPEPVLSVRVR
jgi:hypothetical protein